MRKGETEATFIVATVNDTADEPDGAVTATLAGDGEKGLLYTVAAPPQDAASVKVTDDDAAATAPTFSVGDETANEDVGLMYFTVRLDRAAKQTVKVTLTARESSPVSARYGEDYYWWWPDGLALTFHPGQTEKKMWVYVYNDNHDEDPETFEVALSRPTGGTAIGDGVAVGTIVNNDPMPAAWPARFGRTAAEQALDDLSGRTLVAHGSDDLEDRGFAASLAFDPDPATKRGPSLTLAQDWGGQAKGGLDALFTPETLDRRGGSGAATARWRAEAAYGFPAFSGRFTGSPHMGLGLATGARDYSLGWRLTPAASANVPDLSFGIRATRRESDAAAPEHALGLEINARW